MSQDKTQQQTTEQQASALAQSLASSHPPAEIEGYSMLRHLGSGAFGEVWLALNNTTRRRVAIKFYNRRSVTDVRGLAREVEKLVALSADRYVVQLLDVGWDADPPFYVMDFIERGSLEDLLKSQRKLPVAEALEIFHETAVGLMHLHGKGVLHCDLKPGNVLLDEDNKPRLADFGQSRLSNEAAPSLGTLFYMAPEQADLDAAPDARWDVYALGALFYVMLTGRPPFYDNTLSANLETAGDIRHRLEVYRDGIVNSPLPTKHREVPGVDRQLADIIDRCIASNPKKRFSSVQSVLLALRQRHDAIARRPLLLLGLIGPLLLLLVMLVFGWTAYRQAVMDSDAAITAKAEESNRFAAMFAARSAAEQIDNYFREVKFLINNQTFVEDLTRLLDDEEFLSLRMAVADPNLNGTAELRWKRAELLSSPQREKLQVQLQEHVAGRQTAHIASWWVYDLQGNQLVGIFDSSDDVDVMDRSNTLGRNYSFRSYFTGLPADLIDDSPGSQIKYAVSRDPNQRVHIQEPHISSVFLSEQSQTWKIAFSAPLWKNDQIIAIAGVTVEMGDFVDFSSGPNQYAMMYDARPGVHFGVILEHPLLVELRKRRDQGESNIDAEISEALGVRIDPQFFSTRPFFDPIGKTNVGEKYQHPMIIAAAPIEFADSTTALPSRQESGLMIAVVEDYETVIQPSHELGGRLFRMALIASLVLLAVAIIMWVLVNRMFKESRRRIARAFAGTSESDSSLASHGPVLGSTHHFFDATGNDKVTEVQ